MAPMFALTTTTIGVIGLVIVVGGWVIYGIFNVVAGRREVGSEIELAANRKEYYDDETLEGPRLERVQLLGVIMLAIIVVALPLYWVFEPSRQAGAQEGWDNRFASWGSQLFAPTALPQQEWQGQRCRSQPQAVRLGFHGQMRRAA